MTKQEVITKALKKAGLEYDYTSKNSVKIWYKRVIEDGLEIYAKEYTFTELIFDHDFAKALWGEDGEGIMHGGSGRIGWRHHLARMVVAEYPIKYLAENI